ncbi:MAG TPA: GNAT family N-acetyltransferase [Thermoleophilaceae bacterium]|nr:GNAT family N-acetyltransferase [Thermoleophilaceae bacterium]
MGDRGAFALRPALVDDAAAIAAINAAAGRAGWGAFLPRERLAAFEPPVRRFEAMLGGGTDPGTVVHVATEAEEIVGFVSLRSGGGEIGEIGALYVHPSRWSGGVGRALLARALETLAKSGCREAVLWTEERNERPRRIYETAGWRLDGASRVRDFLGCRLRELRYRIVLADEGARSSAAGSRSARTGSQRRSSSG